MIGAINTIMSIIYGGLATLFPQSPFSQMASVSQGMALGIGWLNWLVPFGEFLGMTASWILVAVVVTAGRAASKVLGEIAGKVV